MSQRTEKGVSQNAQLRKKLQKYEFSRSRAVATARPSPIIFLIMVFVVFEHNFRSFSKDIDYKKAPHLNNYETTEHYITLIATYSNMTSTEYYHSSERVLPSTWPDCRAV